MDGPTYTRNFEGDRLAAYQDQMGLWTIGVGHLLGSDPSNAGTVWTQQQVDETYVSDYALSQQGAIKDVGGVCYQKLSYPRQCVLNDMAFNLGAEGLGAFHSMISYLLSEDWNMASDALLNSKYARQLPRRAKSNALILETGEWPND